MRTSLEYLTLTPALIHTSDAGRNHPGFGRAIPAVLGGAKRQSGHRHLLLAVHPVITRFLRIGMLMAGAAVLSGPPPPTG